MASFLHPPGWVRAPSSRRPPDRRRSRGQSLVEFSLLLPVLLLLVVGGIDFGRVFLGWVSLNNTARIAANYAASNAQQMAAGNTAALAAYNNLVQQDAVTTNCQPPDPIPAPTFTPSAALGGSVRVELSCSFDILTPVISTVLGSQVEVSASAEFPVRVGAVANVPGGGPPTPVAAFTLTPISGDAPLTVSFNNTSTNATSFSWDFDNDGVVDSTAQNPADQVYATPGTYTAALTVSNGLATSTTSHTVTVTTPPGPLADFTFTPTTGTAPLNVSFTDASSSTGTITDWAWDFNGDGTVDSTAQDPSHTFNTAGTYNVTLTVTDDAALTASITKPITVAATTAMCRVPNFKGSTTSDAIQTEWTAAGFNQPVIFNPSRPPEYLIKSQDLKQNTDEPCDTAVITVSK